MAKRERRAWPYDRLLSWDEAFDLVCVGSGLAGCAAAITGAAAGLRVLLLEKGTRVGGTTGWSLGIVWVGNTQTGDSAAETLDYLNYLGGGRNDPDMTRTFVEQSPAALEFFRTAGKVPFYLVKQLPDHYYPLGAGSRPTGRSFQTKPFEARSLGAWQEKLENSPYMHGRLTFEELAAWGGNSGYRNWDHKVLAQREAEDVRTFGPGLAGHFFKAVLEQGVEVRTACPAESLVVENGRVSGVRLVGGKSVQARRGVMLASGLYNSNRRLMRLFDEFNSWPPGGAPRNQGDGLVMALEHGACFAVRHWNLNIMLGYYVPGEEADGQPLTHGAGAREIAYPHCLLVNRHGRRFADESMFGDVSSRLRHFDAASHQLINVPCYLVFDSQYLEKYGLPPLRPGSPPPAWMTSSQTLAGLAAALGIDGAGLEATVERFNGYCSTGVDEEFHRGKMPWARQSGGDPSRENPNLGPVCEPPYYAVELLPINGSAVGLMTNTNGQVLHLRGHDIPGLYACGEVTSGQHYGVGYQAGLSLAGGMTFGWLAARHAAGQ